MKLYNYDRTTLHFIGESTAEDDPMAPGEYLVPAFATATPPPKAAPDEVAVFVPANGRWTLTKLAAEAAAPAAEKIGFDVLRSQWKQALVMFMNMVATALDFDDMAEAVSYADEPAVPKFQIQGAALRAWRSELWAAFDALCPRIAAGEVAEPENPDALIRLLPGFVVPDTASLTSTRYEAPADDHPEAAA